MNKSGRFALLIGTYDYGDTQLNRLRSPRNDIHQLRNVLKSQDRGRFQRIRIADNFDYSELRAEIAWLLEERSPDDFILFYYSGHGIPKSDDELLLTCKDTKYDNPRLHAFSSTDLNHWFNRSRSRRQVIIIDCCYSGAFAQKQFKDNADREFVTERTFMPKEGYGRFLMTACRRNQTVVENPSGLSILTGSLVEGLNGVAAPTSPVITIQDLYDYASDRVTNYATGMTPLCEVTEGAGKLHIAYNPLPRVARSIGSALISLNDDDFIPRLGAVIFIGKSLDRLSPREAKNAREALRNRLPVEVHPEVSEEIEAILYKRPLLERSAEESEEAVVQKRRLKIASYAFGLFLAVFLTAVWFWEPLQEATGLSESAATGKTDSNAPQSPKWVEGEGKAIDASVGSSRTAGTAMAPEAQSPDEGQRVFRDCKDCPEMVEIPAGSASIGSPEEEAGRDLDEGPQRVVDFPAFAIGRMEVTYDDWKLCVSADSCRELEDTHWGRGRLPVVLVSREDAKIYTRWLSKRSGRQYRLPTEAEWEYAARAGTNSQFVTGNSIGAREANFAKAVERAVEVGSYPPNAWGLYDVHGNVSEWVQDCWHSSYHGAPSGPGSWTEEHCKFGVVRGGAWKDVIDSIRLAARSRIRVDQRLLHIGFRVARDLKR